MLGTAKMAERTHELKASVLKMTTVTEIQKQYISKPGYLQDVGA